MDVSRTAKAAVIGWGLLLAGCATIPQAANGPSLDQAIAFSHPEMCRFTEDTSELIGNLVRNDPHAMDSDSWIEPGVVPRNLQDRLGPITRIKHDEWWTVRTEVRGTLWGLPLTAIEQDFPVGGDAGGITFEFDAPVRAVENAARARGLAARAGKSVAMGVPDGMAYEITLSREGRRSHLSCGYA